MWRLGLNFPPLPPQADVSYSTSQKAAPKYCFSSSNCNVYKGTVRPEALKRTSTAIGFWFLFSVLNIWNNFKVLSHFKQKWIHTPACSDHGLYRILSSYWLVHFYLMKKSAKGLHYFGLDCGMLEFSLTSRNPKKNCCLSRISGARFIGKDRGLCTYKPWSENKQEDKRHFFWTLNSFQILKLN